MKTWPTKKLGEICEVFADGDWIETKDQSSNGIRLIQTGNIGCLFYIQKDGRARYISEQTFKRLDCTEVFPGDILISRLPDPVGRACIIPHLDTRMITSVDCTIIRANIKVVVQEYLLYFTESSEYRSQIVMLLSGSTRKRISKSNLAKINIPLPPLEIQKKVVKKIEDLFVKISQAQSFRESAIQDANNLIPATLCKIFEERRSRGWKEKKLSEVVKIIGGGTPSKNNFSYYKGHIPWATVRDLKNDYVVDTEYKISEQAVKESSTNIIPANNIILVTRVGLGKMSIITRDTAINQDLKALIPRDASGLDKIFLFWWLKTQMKFIQSQGRGATVMGVRLELINNLTTPLPPIAEQKKIVERMDALTQKVRQLQQLQSETAINLTTLKQSILHQAFEGRLIN